MCVILAACRMCLWIFYWWKEEKAQVTQSNINKNTPQQLTDKDLFGNETTLAVSEEDIQAALDGDEFRVPLNSPVILVQSGNRAPETIMQEEMRKYYTVSTFSGIPDRQKPLTCNKTKIKMRTRMLPVLRIWTGCRHCVLWLQKDIRKRLLFTRIHCRQENMTLRWNQQYGPTIKWKTHRRYLPALPGTFHAGGCGNRWVGYLVAGELWI